MPPDGAPTHGVEDRTRMLWREGVELAFWDPWGIGQHCDVLADQPPAHRHIQGRAEYRAVVGHAARERPTARPSFIMRSMW